MNVHAVLGTGKVCTPLGCWEEKNDDTETAVCRFLVDDPNGGKKECGHSIKIKGGADGLASHAESHGITKERAKKARAEGSASLHAYFPPAPVLSKEQTKSFTKSLPLRLLVMDGLSVSLTKGLMVPMIQTVPKRLLELRTLVSMHGWSFSTLGILLLQAQS